MIYSYFVKKLVRQSFANVQDQNYDEVLKVMVPNVTHHFAGDHALGGTRHDKETLRRWFNRLGKVLPNIQFDVKNVWVKGPPWQTTIIAQWVATATLANGDPAATGGGMPYFYWFETKEQMLTAICDHALFLNPPRSDIDVAATDANVKRAVANAHMADLETLRCDLNRHLAHASKFIWMGTLRELCESEGQEAKKFRTEFRKDTGIAEDSSPIRAQELNSFVEFLGVYGLG